MLRQRPVLVIALLATWVLPTSLGFAAPHGDAPVAHSDEHGSDAHGDDAHGGGHGADYGAHSPIQNLSGFSKWWHHRDTVPPPFLLAILNFVIFAFLLIKFGGPLIVKATRDRSRTIAEQLAESAKLREQAQEKLDEYSKRLKSLEPEIAKMIKEIRDEAEAEKQRILGDAEERAKRMQRDAEVQIKAEILRVRVSLEKETVIAAVSMAEKTLREKANDADQKSLVSQFLKEVKSSEQGRRPS